MEHNHPSETEPTAEIIHQPAEMLIFDLDGVVTNPENNEVSLEVLGHVVHDLHEGNPVAFNTGRTIEWVQENIVPHLQEQCSADELARLVMVAEMGGVVAAFHEGEIQIEHDDKLALPATFVDDIVALLEAGGYSDYMFWDKGKKTMGSVEKHKDVSVEAFAAERTRLVAELHSLIEQHQLHDFKIGETIIATDIAHATAGKHKGARQILSWLERNSIAPQSFQTFGDSASDAAMAEELSETGKPTTFIFVGPSDKFTPTDDDTFEAVHMPGFSQGTEAYLRNLER